MRSFWYRDRQCGKGRPVCAGPGQRICLASRQAADWLAGWAFGAGPCPRDGQDNCSQCTLSVQACQESVIHGENSRRKCLQAAVRCRLCGSRGALWDKGTRGEEDQEGETVLCPVLLSGHGQPPGRVHESGTLSLKCTMQKYKRKCESCDITSMASFSRANSPVLSREYEGRPCAGNTPCAACTRPGQTIFWFWLRAPAGRPVGPACCRHAVFCRP